MQIGFQQWFKGSNDLNNWYIYIYNVIKGFCLCCACRYDSCLGLDAASVISVIDSIITCYLQSSSHVTSRLISHSSINWGDFINMPKKVMPKNNLHLWEIRCKEQPLMAYCISKSISKITTEFYQPKCRRRMEWRGPDSVQWEERAYDSRLGT